MKKALLVAIFAAVSLSLIACGGGGADGPIPQPIPSAQPTQQPPPTYKVSFKSGFANVGHTTASNRRIAKFTAVQSATPQDVILGSPIEPSADFMIADSYIQTAPGSIDQAQLVAFLTTTDGTMNGITSDTITNANVQYTVISGNPVTFTPEAVPTVVPSAMPDPGVIIGGAILSPPTSVGQTVFQVSANVNGTTQTNQNTANTYPGMCIAAPNDNQPNGCIPAAYIGSSGRAETVGANQTDIYLSQDANGNTLVNVPFGGVILDNTNINQVMTAPTIPQSSGSFVITGNPGKGTLNPTTTLVFFTHDGRYVKWNPTIFQNYDSGTAVGNPEQGYGMYLTTSVGSPAFAY